jgi:hypothetical protein
MGFLLCSLSCATTSPFSSYSGEVSVSAAYSIEGDDVVFHQETIQKVQENDIIESKGEFYLDRIVFGYGNQLPGIVYSEESISGLHFILRNVDVKKGYTFNLIDPGPIVKIKMEFDVLENGSVILTESYKTRVNMARIINEGKFWNWLDNEEISNTDNQIKTFERGLRNIYRGLYFKHLDISLEQ